MIITLCGSARFEHLFKEWNERLTLAGHVVFSLAVYPSDKGNKDWYTPEQKEALDRAHLGKIAASNAIVVVSDDTGYYGESTMREISFARDIGKLVFFNEAPSWLHTGLPSIYPDEWAKGP